MPSIFNIFAKRKRPLSLRPPSDVARARRAGEQTDQQAHRGVASITTDGTSILIPRRACYETWRDMRKCPTVAIARASAMYPVMLAEVGYEGRNDEAVEFIRSQISPLWRGFVRDALFALDYGWKPFEIVYRPGNWTDPEGTFRGQRWLLDKLKPLRVDSTAVLIERTGAFAGLVNEGIDGTPVNLPVGKALVYSYDGEDGDFYGRSRMESIREEAWCPWLDAREKLAKTTKKISGTIPRIRYTPGSVQDASGNVIDAFDQAKKTLASLSNADGVTYPVEFQSQFMDDAAQLMHSGVDISDLLTWKIDLLETTPGHCEDIIRSLEYYDRLMLRGWLVPERAALEAQSGTRADAEAHADISIAVAQGVIDDLVTLANDQIVKPLLEFNYGPDAVDDAKLKAPKIGSDEGIWLRELVGKLLMEPSKMRQLGVILDIDAMLDQANVPKAAEVIDPADIEAPELEPRNDPEPVGDAGND